ncbi:hypothetical protein WICPIJ_006731 [Wickerhamomyces pijperi]|uniref:carnosine N-methyltransferase n=1 Tax=Wickerhamomyces pijperi TaxID=599730 RepID=A0A9P8Q1I2_WICPI|nr:hypothetical protein WICPIJ_006731 [Wickerhamomyces pijperi]
MDSKDLEEEYKAIHQVLSAFHNYTKHTQYTLIEPKRKRYEALTARDKDLLSWFPGYITQIEAAVDSNQQFFNAMVNHVSTNWGIELEKIGFIETSASDYEKVKKCLKQCYREWSLEAQNERDISFHRTLDHLVFKYPDIRTRPNCKILIPGCGLGRQNFELIREGFQVQGNEFDYFMILISSFLVNDRLSKAAYQIHPFIHDGSHQRSRVSQFRPINIPDIDQIQQLSTLQRTFGNDADVMDLMSITTGSFIDLYGPNDKQIVESSYFTKSSGQFRDENKGKFDFVISSFFIDTACNYLEYLDTFSHCLKDNGEWINFGPLQWHFENSMENLDIRDGFGIPSTVPLSGLELSREDVLELTRNLFTFEALETGIKSPFASDDSCSSKFLYDCDFWIAKKK